METGPKLLLIGENRQAAFSLTKRLLDRGCTVEFAGSYLEACSLLGVRRFDVVLSPMKLDGVSLFPLIGLLTGRASVTLFYSQMVQDGFLWWPALRNGKDCFGSSTLRSGEFVVVLDEVIGEIFARAAMEGKSPESDVRLSGSPDPLPQAAQASPAAPKPAVEVKRLQHETA